MARKTLNQKGFGAIEILLVVILVVIIVGVGYYVYHSQNAANNTLNSASVITNSAAANKPTSSDAVNRVKVAYTNYIKATDQTKRLATIKPYVTGSLYNKIAGDSSGSDPVLCAQANPDSLTVVLNKTATTSTQVGVNVEEKFGATTNTPQVLVSLPSLKITSITCAP